MNELLTIKEAADKIGITTEKLVNLTVKRMIGHVRVKRGEPFKYDHETVDRYIARSKAKEEAKLKAKALKKSKTKPVAKEAKK